jgi:hypothetical protein
VRDLVKLSTLSDLPSREKTSKSAADEVYSTASGNSIAGTYLAARRSNAIAQHTVKSAMDIAGNGIQAISVTVPNGVFSDHLNVLKLDH